MSRVELLGGPLDGKRVELASPDAEFYFGIHSQPAPCYPESEGVILLTSEIYSRTSRRATDGTLIYSWHRRS